MRDLRDLLDSWLRLGRCGCNRLIDYLRIDSDGLWDFGLCGGRNWCDRLHLWLNDGGCLYNSLLCDNRLLLN